MIRLYPPRRQKGQSFKGVKKVVVPNQSMTLQQILKRFIKHEALPIVKEGVYSDEQDIDLEKFKHEDPVDQEEMIQEQRVRTEGLKQKAEKAKTSAMEKAKAKKKEEEEQLFATWQKQQSDPKNVPPKPPTE